jgi:hypothetical protein
MYTLYYLNRNLQIGVINVDSLDVPVRIPEDLVFCNLRKGINFIKEPHECIDFTDVERLIMNSEFTDSTLLKEYDFRRQNTFLNPLCQIDLPTDIEILYFIGNDLYFNIHKYQVDGVTINLLMSSDGVNYDTTLTVAFQATEGVDFVANDVDNEGTYSIVDVYQEGVNWVKFTGGEMTRISNIYHKP